MYRYRIVPYGIIRYRYRTVRRYRKYATVRYRIVRYDTVRHGTVPVNVWYLHLLRPKVRIVHYDTSILSRCRTDEQKC